MRLAARDGNVPTYITENGLGAKDPIVDEEVLDQPRIDYLQEHIKASAEAIRLGAEVRGFSAWSFIDLLSWLNGCQKQYGFVSVDREKNLARQEKLSFHWKERVIETSGKVLWPRWTASESKAEA